LEDWREDLQARPGRVESSLRIVLATTVALVAMMVLQVPNIAFALYVILIVSNENPAISVRTGAASLIAVAFALSISLVVVIVTDNNPFARLATLAAMTFFAGMITVATSVPALGPIFGLVVGVAVHLWESHAPPDKIVKANLWLLAAFATGIAAAVAVSYLFSMRSPARRLAGQLRTRYGALAVMFGAYADRNATEHQRRTAAQAVSRLAAEGHRGMLELHRQIVDRNLPRGDLPTSIQQQIIGIAELMDYSAAFGLQAVCPDEHLQSRCQIIAQQCSYLARELRSDPGILSAHGDSVPRTHLERVERILRSFGSITTGGEGSKCETLPSRRVPLVIPGAGSNIGNVAFALKISLCATICYIVYHAIDWPGISTSVTTVMITGLVTSGAMKQKLTFRLLGAIVGGLILGLGVEVFVLPFMDSITPLVVVVGSVAFLAAWIGAGPRFNYVGIQIGFAFYLVSVSGFSTPTELAPARDRLAGIMLAVIVMWFVFDQIWPVRTTTEMRRVVALVLKDASRVVALIDSQMPRDGHARESEVLRDRLARGLSTVRTLNEAAQYEFGRDRESHIRTASRLMRMSMTAVALVWNHAAIPNESDESDSKSDPALASLRQTVQEGLFSIAEAIEREHSIEAKHLVANESNSEYARLTISRFNELVLLSAFDP
jgi:multidrug resistance protein MdtO